MKNLFAINVQTFEKNYEPLIKRSVSMEMELKLDLAETALSNVQYAAKLPLWLRIIQLVSLIGAVCCLGGLLDAFLENAGEEPVADIWARIAGNGAVIVIAVGAVCLVLFIVLLIMGAVRAKTVLSSSMLKNCTENRTKILNSCYEELGVPPDADEIDLFSKPYRINSKGKEVRGNAAVEYANIGVKIFKKNDSIYISDSVEIVKIPISSFTVTNVIPKRVTFFGWPKNQSQKSKFYRQYKIFGNTTGVMSIKNCFSVGVLINGKEMEIVIPPYEREILEKYIKV